MKIEELEWDDQNIEHIAKHEVTPQEVEDVCFGLHISQRVGERRHVLSGQSSAGKYLNVVVERLGGQRFRPITAFEMSDNYKRTYKKRLRGKGGT
ncbi:MAG: hypothetical protein E3J66_04085 [Dehalococcoidia bacterium]|nr:MAG: hypothetical protein E3J66_04085 [Dehalococcoidia bacterium]